MGAKKGVNEKKQKGMALKASNKAANDAVKATEQERQEGEHFPDFLKGPVPLFIHLLTIFIVSHRME